MSQATTENDSRYATTTGWPNKLISHYQIIKKSY